MSIPYADASGSPDRARGQIRKILENFGCESVGFMDEFNTHTLILAFTWKGRNIQLRATAQGWANAYLKAEPYNSRRKGTREAYEARALKKGSIAVNSILRDWVKGQMTAVETGILTFEEVFMPHMMLPDGRRVVEAVHEKFPALADHSEAS